MSERIINILLVAEKGFTYPAEEMQHQFEDQHTKAAVDALEKALGLDGEHYTPDKEGLVELITNLESAREDLGFRNGFRVGVQLMRECL